MGFPTAVSRQTLGGGHSYIVCIFKIYLSNVIEYLGPTVFAELSTINATSLSNASRIHDFLPDIAIHQHFTKNFYSKVDVSVLQQRTL